jgi:hypothetical protein
MCHQHQDEDEHDSPDQTGQENGATKRRRENDLSAASLFSRIWFLIHDAAPFEIQDVKATLVPQAWVPAWRRSAASHRA